MQDYQEPGVDPKKDDWVVAYSHMEMFKLKQNNLLTTLPILPTQWKVSFKMLPNHPMAPPRCDSMNSYWCRPPQPKWRTVLFMTDGSALQKRGKVKSGFRAGPAVYFHLEKGLNVQNSFNQPRRHSKTFHEVSKKSAGEWTDVKIEQKLLKGKLMYRVIIDGLVRLSKENRKPENRTNVEVWAANPPSSPGSRDPPVIDGWMKDLVIKI